MNWEENDNSSSSSSSSSTGQFSVKWKEFRDNLTYRMSHFFRKGRLTDVTLSTSDGQTKRAHKLLLSLASPYFKKIFEAHQHNNLGDTIVVLHQIRFRDLENILNFVYCGRVQVNQEDLTRFLQAAELLQIDGLTSTFDSSRPESQNPSGSERIQPLVDKTRKQISCSSAVEFLETTMENVHGDADTEGEELSKLSITNDDDDENEIRIEEPTEIADKSSSSPTNEDFDFAAFPEVQIEPLVEVISLEGHDGGEQDGDGVEGEGCDNYNDNDPEQQGQEETHQDFIYNKDDDDEDGEGDGDGNSGGGGGVKEEGDDKEEEDADEDSNSVFYNAVQNSAATAAKSAKRRRRHSSAFQLLAMDNYDFVPPSRPHSISSAMMTNSSGMEVDGSLLGHVGIGSCDAFEFDEIGFNGSPTPGTFVDKKKGRKKGVESRKRAKVDNGLPTERLPCALCGKDFKNKNVLYNHRSVYHHRP